MNRRRTDNSAPREKIALRLDALESIDAESVRVLDAYHGHGVLWKELYKKSSKAIDVLGIDIEDRGPGVLMGDNRKFLKSLDLHKFDLVDLDAYGSPIDQLRILFDRGYSGVVVCTFIRTCFRRLPFRFLNELGYPTKMIKKCPTLFSRNGYEKFLLWLANRGIKNTRSILIEATGRSAQYLWFSCT